MASYDALAEQAYNRLLQLQRRDGSFPYSWGDYRMLSDQRSYPRYQSMILYHLLLPQAVPRPTPARKEVLHDSAC